ncbi:WD40-repeat-containing domain protein [Schizophyllum amplum]|uniref:DNA damage-binding protein CMR1 n=1 Tax=Schizophyllum amplum TaxID=97359 RepID=A0A550BUJ7_9AGAR|nr:WD40-repeat-containing domain protein [Auriculariopsis ampla]
MPKISQYELEREANIARNRALLAALELDDAAADLGFPAKPPPDAKTKESSESKAKPVQPRKRKHREEETPVPRRQSTRLRTVIDPNENPSKKRKREAEAEARRAEQETARLEAEERARAAKRPRHQDLDLHTVAEDGDATQSTDESSWRHAADPEAFVYSAKETDKEDAEISTLRDALQGLQVASRAKVTQDRIYSIAYHPERSKDLIFFGDVATDPTTEEGGRYWRLQVHWPATSKSSISTVKVDPLDPHTVYTTSYDCTLRSVSFESGVSREIYAAEGGALLSSLDLPPGGHEIWISDAAGGVVHLDLREERGKARYYGLSSDKIGAISVNPSRPHFLAAASNDRTVRIWDTRQLTMESGLLGDADEDLDISEDIASAWGYETVNEFAESKTGRGTMRGEWKHDKAAGSVYWDARGRSLVSTSYDDKLRVWDFKSSAFSGNAQFPSMRPLRVISHNCQTGRWLTPLRARWTENPDIYPHFTVGNMQHSLDVFSAKGELLARLQDKSKITAVQAVTCSHPSIAERAVSGNGSGRCVLWAPEDA